MGEGGRGEGHLFVCMCVPRVGSDKTKKQQQREICRYTVKSKTDRDANVGRTESDELTQIDTTGAPLHNMGKGGIETPRKKQLKRET